MRAFVNLTPQHEHLSKCSSSPALSHSDGGTLAAVTQMSCIVIQILDNYSQQDMGVGYVKQAVEGVTAPF